MVRSCCTLLLASFSLVTACQGMQGALHHRRIKFTPEMDDSLRQAVEEVGTGNWGRTTSVYKRILGLRDTDPSHNEIRRCRERWKHYLSVPQIKQPWTEEEDNLLVIKAQELGQKWTKLSTFFKGRSDIDVKNRFFKLSRHRRHARALAHVKHNLRPTHKPTLAAQPTNPVPPLTAVVSQPLMLEAREPFPLTPNTPFVPAPSLISVESAPLFNNSTFNNFAFFNTPPFRPLPNCLPPTRIPNLIPLPPQPTTRIREHPRQRPLLETLSLASQSTYEEEQLSLAPQRPSIPPTEAILQAPVNSPLQGEYQPTFTFHGPSEQPTETASPSPLPSLAAQQNTTEEDPQEDIMTWFDQILQESRQSHQNSFSHNVDTHSAYSYDIVDPLAYQIDSDGLPDSSGILSPLRITTDSGKSDDESES